MRLLALPVSIMRNILTSHNNIGAGKTTLLNYLSGRDISQNLERYKRDIGNCQTAAREMRDEASRLNDLHDRYMEEAENAERQATVAEEEAAR